MAKASDYTVAVGAGHYLTTQGKETPYITSIGRKIKEWEFNQPTANFLEEDLQRCGFKTVRLNSPNEDTPLNVRTDKANNAKADIGISIHFNALDDKFDPIDPEGLGIYIYPNSVGGRKLAEHILKFLKGGTIQKNRGIIEANFHMLRETRMPFVLSENGFMDNRREALLMIDPDYQREVADEHCRGICSYFGVDYIPKRVSSWDKKPMDAFVTKRELLEFTGKLPTTPIPRIGNPRLIRKYNTNIHVYEAKKGMKVDMDLGIRWEREKVTKVVKDKLALGEEIVLAINCGMYSYKEGSEHNTLYIDEGLYFNPPSNQTMDFIYYKDGTTKIVNIKGYDREKLSAIQNTAHWGIGTSYSLVQEGQANLENQENFAHSKSREPRTMFGWKLDGTFMLVVTDGRVDGSAGLTAIEQAELMLLLGCHNAVNVDGGGSSIMVEVKNGVIKIVNKLANNYEREVGSMMLVSMKGWD